MMPQRPKRLYGDKAVLLHLHKRLEAYNPDQPRDANGRWGHNDQDREFLRQRRKTMGVDEESLKGVRQLDPEEAKGLQDYAKMLIPHSAKYALLAEHGKVYTETKPAEKLGPMKQCYTNAYHGAMDNDDLTYVEGLASTKSLPGFPVEHAWNVNKQGQVIDPTWNDGSAYFGIPFKTDYIQKVAVRSGVYGVLSHTNLPLLKREDTDFKASIIRAMYNPDEPRDDHGRWGDDSGKEFYVYRVQSPTSTSLAGKNAGDLHGVVSFLWSDAQEFTQSGSHVGKYLVTNDTPGKFTAYQSQRGGAGTLQQNHPNGIGRSQEPIDWGKDAPNQVNWYSFGNKGYSAKLVALAPLAAIQKASDKLATEGFRDELSDAKAITDAFEGGKYNIKAAYNPDEPRDSHGRWSSDESTTVVIPRSEYPLTKDQTRVETKFRRQIANDPEKAKADYRKQFGNVLNADNAKELSPDYRKDRTSYAAAVHEPAAWLVKQLFNEDLQRPTEPNKSNAVMFTAGGAGAGKTTGIESNPTLKAVFDQAHTVFDGTMRPAEKASALVAKTLAAGKDAVVLYVHRDPVEAFVNGVLPRAMKTGRTVMLREFAAQHSSIQQSMRALQNTYGDNPRFAMSVIDNSKTSGDRTSSTLQDIKPNPSYEQLVPLLTSKLKDAYSSGAISKKVYKAILGSGDRIEHREIGI